MIYLVMGLLSLLCIILGIFLARQEILFKERITKLQYENKQLQENMDNAACSNISLTSSLDDTIGELQKERSRNKSVEVNTGFILEKAAPFLDVFEEDPRGAKFLGDPIDYVVFTEEDICFIEVKTGKARLSTKQNKIKKMVEEGKVRFKTIRF